MAVSSDEKSVIVTGAMTNGSKDHDFALLPDEHGRWESFAGAKRVKLDENGFVATADEIEKPIWRDYVRHTHSERSGEWTIRSDT